MAMTSTASTENTFHATSVDEPESISFRQSLKFFQEQLITNGKSFPLPASAHLINSEATNKYAIPCDRSPNVYEKTKIDEVLDDDITSVNSCKISIPTVDTILESVRVLRAIQKSQEERGSAWTLDVTTRLDIDQDSSLLDTLQKLKSTMQCDASTENILLDEQSNTYCENNEVDEMLIIGKSEGINGNTTVDDISLERDIEELTSPLNTSNELCSFWPKNVIEQQMTTNKMCETRTENTFEFNSKYEIQEVSKFDINLVMTQIVDSQKDLKYREKGELNMRSDDYDNSSNGSKLSEQNHTSNLSDDSTCDNLIKNTLSNAVVHLSNHTDEQQTLHPLTMDTSKQNGSVDEITVKEEKMLNFSDLKMNSQSSYEQICHVSQSDSVDGAVLLEKLGTENYSIRSESNDCDSGIGTQRSTCSLSPTFHAHHQKDYWSDTGSSQYLSAECSPCPSPNSVFGSSPGFNSNMRNSAKDYSDLVYPETIPDSEKEISLSTCNENIETTEHKEIISSVEETILHNNEQTTEFFRTVDTLITECEVTPLHSTEIISDYEEQKNDFSNAVTRVTTNCQREESPLSADEVPDDLEQETESASTLTTGVTEHETEVTSKATTESKETISIATCLQPKDSPERELTEVSLKADENENQPNVEHEAILSSSENENLSQDNTEHKTIPSLLEITGTNIQQSTDIEETTDSNIVCEITDRTPESMIVNTADSNHVNNEESYCSFTTIELTPPTYSMKTLNQFEESLVTINGTHKAEAEAEEKSEITVEAKPTNTEENSIIESKETDDVEVIRNKKITTSSYNLISILESLYTIPEYPVGKVLPTSDKFEKEIFILSRGAFCENPEGIYNLYIEDDFLYIKEEEEVLLSLRINYAEVSIIERTVLKLDTRLGRCLYFKCNLEEDLMELHEQLILHCLKQWESDCLQLVHYPLKCHQNIIIVDLGSCSTRAGILMDEPTLPTIFFPTVCATDKINGSCIYGMEALQPEVRQNSTLSFPVRPSVKITKHTIDIDLLGGLFKKIFSDLRVDQTKYRVQVCLPRSLSINTQSALVKLLLEDLKVEAVSLANQALLTLYAHDVSTAIVVDLGDRMDILPIVDGFIVETGVTKLPYGGQRLIHHMKHALAEKHISLSSEIDSYIVQYLTENLSYIAEDYDKEVNMVSHFPEEVKKSVDLPTINSDGSAVEHVTLGEARFKVPEGLFQPELWGLDCQGIHHLVHKAIQSTGVDARRKVTENIYISGGVTLLPGFVERLNKEIAKLNKTKVKPRVFASNYRYHSTYIGACKFARKDVFSQVCVNLNEYSRNSYSSLKKFVLCI